MYYYLCLFPCSSAVSGGLGVTRTLSSMLGVTWGTVRQHLLTFFWERLQLLVWLTQVSQRFFSKKVAAVGENKYILIFILCSYCACASQNIVPVHIAYIPILIPPLLVVMNRLKIDRRGVACAIAFGHKAPYIAIPMGFGLIFMGIIKDNMTLNGMEVTLNDVASVNWILAVAMLIGL